ncbi:MAG: threonine/serine dehydratase [Pseudomonadota bacterium]
MIDVSHIEAAAHRLAGAARRTPLLRADAIDALAGRPVFVKAECLQHTGSFKFRGAWSALSAMPRELRAKGVIAYSSGNHAQGIARAAHLFGIPATIVMPRDAPAAKVAGTRRYNAEIVFYDRDTESREALGLALMEEQGLTLVRPYDEPMVIAGQGTTGLEIAAQARANGIEQAEVLVCCGGGGLTAGTALALAAHAPQMIVRPVEPEGFDDVARSLISGRRETNPTMSGSICDAVVTDSPGEITFPILQRLCGPGLVVTDDEALHAMALALRHLKIVLEPGGAIALAAALFRPELIAGDSIIAVASGGNADPEILAKSLRLAQDLVGSDGNIGK